MKHTLFINCYPNGDEVPYLSLQDAVSNLSEDGVTKTVEVSAHQEKVFVIVEGGVVQSIESTIPYPQLDVVVIDRDEQDSEYEARIDEYNSYLDKNLLYIH